MLGVLALEGALLGGRSVLGALLALEGSGGWLGLRSAGMWRGLDASGRMAD